MTNNDKNKPQPWRSAFHSERTKQDSLSFQDQMCLLFLMLAGLHMAGIGGAAATPMWKLAFMSVLLPTILDIGSHIVRGLWLWVSGMWSKRT